MLFSYPKDDAKNSESSLQSDGTDIDSTSIDSTNNAGGDQVVAPNNPLVSYDIKLEGKTFTISSPRSEAHIRKVENMVSQTHAEITKKFDKVVPLNTALLTALNLADQLVALEEGNEAKLNEFMQVLDEALQSCETLSQAPFSPSASHSSAPPSGQSSAPSPSPSPFQSSSEDNF